MKNQNEFFNKLSIECGLTDLLFIKRYYHGLQRLILNELRLNGYIELPDLGRLSVKIIGASGRRAVPNPDGSVKECKMKPSRAITFASSRYLKALMKTWQ